MSAKLTRRSFVTAATVLAGLGLTACGSNGSSTNEAQSTDVTGVEPQNGSPATTDLSKLPLPEKGKTYNNPKSRDEVQDGGTLNLSLSEIGPDFNQLGLNGNTTYMKYLWQLYMPLNPFKQSADGGTFTPDPNFVDSINVEDVDGKEVATIKIADKATFNDGTPIDWRAFESVWKACSGQDENYTPASTDGYQQIESVVAGSSDKELKITFATPYYPVESLLVFLHPDAAADAETFNNGFNENPHNEWGAGPFIVDTFTAGESISFKRNPNWWGDEAKLESIVYKQMDAQAMFNAFKNGEIDATEPGSTGSSEMLSNFSGMEDAEIRRSYSISIANIEINSTRDSMQDINVRKAFMQCIDVPTILSIVYQGVNWSEDRIGSLLICQWMDGYENNLPEDITANTTADAEIAAAKKTLEDAGYEMGSDGYYAKDGQQVSFSFTTFGDSNLTKNRAAAIQKMCKDAGMNLTIDNHPASEFSKTLTSGDWDTVLFAWSAGPASYNNGGQIFGSTSSSNFTHLGTPELDEKFNAVCGIADHAEQMKALNEAEKEALQSYGFIPLFVGADVVVAKKGLANYGPALLESPSPENMGWEK
ncbi:MAG: ABC transporter family substrate-binding protein [Atopobiaceae bacterium]|jgi:peptide/nickel transport system substrate-binding protein